MSGSVPLGVEDAGKGLRRGILVYGHGQVSSGVSVNAIADHQPDVQYKSDVTSLTFL